ncbi:MAG: DUF5412 family protein [Prosthecobacter sp.]|uniref:DUF5412 family protein n=1 Tax=Prosthecobacter sp. TaxID=1965333 RepID=UPI0038FDBE99
MNESQSKPTKKRVLLVLGSVLLLAVGGFALFICCLFPSVDVLCANDNLVETVSPNGQFKAVTFRRNCGASTSYSTGVSILSARRKLPNEAGNVFTANHEPSITVRWIDDRHLSISGETQTQFLHLTEIRGIRITYD